MVKTTKMRINRALLLLMMVLLTGCIHQNTDSCSVEYLIHIKPEDNSGFSIADAPDLTDGYLYIFDQHGMLVAKRYISKDAMVYQEPLLVELCPNQHYEMVVWTATDIEKMTQISPVVPLHQNNIFFLKDKKGYNFITSSLYFGANKLLSQAGKAKEYKEDVVIRRKLAAMHVSLIGVPTYHDAADYRVEVEGGLYGAFTFGGKISGASKRLNRYQSELVWAERSKLLAMPNALRVAPTSIDKPFIVSLFYQDKLIKKFTKDHIETPLAPQAGERLNLLVDMTQNSGGIGDIDAHLQVVLRVSDWNKVELWEEW